MAGENLEELRACLLCGHAPLDLAPEQPAPPFGLVECSACGGVFLSPRPRAEEMGQFYTEFHAEQMDRPASPREVRRARRHLRRLQRHAGSPGRLLEIGPADGYFCAAAREAGWQAEGLELSAAMVSRARTLFQLEFRQGDLLATEYPLASFDAVCLFQCIEHVHAPRPYLERLHALLKPGGLLVLSTPNVLAAPGKGHLPTNGWVIPQHVAFFTPGSLVRLVEDLGFQVIGWRLRQAAAWEVRLGWRPWRTAGNGWLSRFLRDRLSPFGLFLVARKRP